MIVLEVLDGNQNRAIYKFGPGQFILGKGDHCDLILSDCHVSRSHAALEIAPEKISIRDLGSTNGTWHNGERLNGEAPINAGDRFEFGDLSVVVIEQEGASKSKPASNVRPLKPVSSKNTSTEKASSDTGTPKQDPPSPKPEAKEVAQAPPAALSNNALKPAAPAIPAVTAKASANDSASSVASQAAIQQAAKPEAAEDTQVRKKTKRFSVAEYRMLKQKLYPVLRAKLQGVVPAIEFAERARVVENAIADELTDAKARLIHGFSVSGLVEELVNELWGLGPLEPLLRDDGTEIIYVDGPQQVSVQPAAINKALDCAFVSEESYREVITRMMRYPQISGAGTAHSTIDIALSDQYVATIVDSVHLRGSPRILIKRCGQKSTQFKDLLAAGFITQEAVEFLLHALQTHQNIVVAGRKGAGKTALLKALTATCRPPERVVVVEEFAELSGKSGATIDFIARAPGAQDGADVANLIETALGLEPDRLVLGNCDINNIEAFLDCAISGLNSVMTSMTADSPGNLIKRLEMLLLKADGTRSPESARRLLSHGFNIVVQVGRTAAGERKVTQIAEVAHVDQSQISLIDIFKLNNSDTLADNGESELVATGYKPLCFQDFLADGG